MVKLVWMNGFGWLNYVSTMNRQEEFVMKCYENNKTVSGNTNKLDYIVSKC